MEPLHHHQGAVLEAEKINDIFYQIPEICTFHLQFIKDLSEFMSDPNKMEKIGKLFVEQVRYNSTICCIHVHKYKQYV